MIQETLLIGTIAFPSPFHPDGTCVQQMAILEMGVVANQPKVHTRSNWALMSFNVASTHLLLI